MLMSSEPNADLREALADAHRASPQPLALSISAESAALYHHLTGRVLGYPTYGETLEDIERHRLAALAGTIMVQLLEGLADGGDDDEWFEALTDAFMSHPRLTDEGRAILKALAGAVGPALGDALPHLFERTDDAG